MKNAITKILLLVMIMSVSVFFIGCNKDNKTADQNNNKQSNNDSISPVSNENDEADPVADTDTPDVKDSSFDSDQPEEENSEITTIKKYYSFLSDNNLEEAYQMRSNQTGTSYEKFKGWYKNAQYLKPFDFKKTSSGSYQFYVDYKDRNNAATKFKVEMIVIENKINTLSSVEADKGQGEEDISGWLTYINMENKFKIRYPKTHAVMEYKDNPRIISFNFKDTNNADYYGGEIYIKIGDDADTADSILAEIKKECEEVNLCADISENKTVDLSNVKGVQKITYSRAIGGYATSYFFTGKDGQVNFELNFNFEEDEIRGKIIDSFEFF